MIPEAQGATPFGIFQLAEAYLLAARSVSVNTRVRSAGPTRLLCYHASELFLKAFLRAKGMDVERLRSFGHDLHAMVLSSKTTGIDIDKPTVNALAKLAERNDYVRVRYMVVDKQGDIRPGDVLALTVRIRESVRLGLGMDEYGNPQ